MKAALTRVCPLCLLHPGVPWGRPPLHSYSSQPVRKGLKPPAYIQRPSDSTQGPFLWHLSKSERAERSENSPWTLDLCSRWPKDSEHSGHSWPEGEVQWERYWLCYTVGFFYHLGYFHLSSGACHLAWVGFWITCRKKQMKKKIVIIIVLTPEVITSHYFMSDGSDIM